MRPVGSTLEVFVCSRFATSCIVNATAPQTDQPLQFGPSSCIDQKTVVCPKWHNGKGGDEQTLLRSIQEALEAGDILMGDAFFPTYFFIAGMQEKGVDILMEQQGSRQRTTDFRRGRKLGQRDHLIVIEKPKRKPDWMSDEAYQVAPQSHHGAGV